MKNKKNLKLISMGSIIIASIGIPTIIASNIQNTSNKNINQKNDEAFNSNGVSTPKKDIIEDNNNNMTATHRATIYKKTPHINQYQPIRIFGQTLNVPEHLQRFATIYPNVISEDKDFFYFGISLDTGGLTIPKGTGGYFIKAVPFNETRRVYDPFTDGFNVAWFDDGQPYADWKGNNYQEFKIRKQNRTRKYKFMLFFSRFVDEYGIAWTQESVHSEYAYNVKAAREYIDVSFEIRDQHKEIARGIITPSSKIQVGDQVEWRMERKTSNNTWEEVITPTSFVYSEDHKYGRKAVEFPIKRKETDEVYRILGKIASGRQSYITNKFIINEFVTDGYKLNGLSKKSERMYVPFDIVNHHKDSEIVDSSKTEGLVYYITNNRFERNPEEAVKNNRGFEKELWRLFVDSSILADQDWYLIRPYGEFSFVIEKSSRVTTWTVTLTTTPSYKFRHGDGIKDETSISKRFSYNNIKY